MGDCIYRYTKLEQYPPGLKNTPFLVFSAEPDKVSSAVSTVNGNNVFDFKNDGSAVG